MKKICLVLASALLSIDGFCQKVSWFAGGSAYLDRNLAGSVYGKFNVGFDYQVHKNVSPEVEVNYYFGFLRDKENLNSNNIPVDNLSRSFNAYGIAFVPKITFDDDDKVGSGVFQILPRHSIAKIVANGNLFTLNEPDPKNSTTEDFSFSEIRHSVGIGIGFICNLSDKSNDRLATNLYYDGINFGNSISNLKYATNKFSTRDAFGLGVNYYFALGKK